MSDQTFYSSITIEAPVPIDPRFIVETDENIPPATLTDLLTIGQKYPNMFVFVRDKKQFYYLKDASNGETLADWIAFGASGGFTAYDGGKSYIRGEQVYVGASGESFYIAKTASTGVNPVGNPTEWLQVGAGGGSSVSADFSIPDNSVANGDATRVFVLDYSALGMHPIVETWLYEDNGSTIEKTPCDAIVDLDRDAANAVSSGKLRIEFNGKIDDIQSDIGGSPGAITGKITIR